MQTLSGPTITLDNILDNPITPDKLSIEELISVPKALLLDSPTPPLLTQIDSAATSQTLDFLTTPALTPIDAGSPQSLDLDGQQPTPTQANYAASSPEDPLPNPPGGDTTPLHANPAAVSYLSFFFLLTHNHHQNAD